MDFWLSVQNCRNRTGFWLSAVLIGSSCRCKGFVCSALSCNNPLIACRNFRNCTGILLLYKRCNSSCFVMVVGDLCCMDYKGLRIVGSMDMEVMWCNHYKDFVDTLDYIDSSLPLRRRTCFKKKLICSSLCFCSIKCY